MRGIKRVLFIFGVTAAVASAFAGYLRCGEALTACAVLLSLAALFVLLKSKLSSFKWFAAVFVCAACFFALACGFKADKIAPVERLNGNHATVYGYIYDTPSSTGGYQTLYIKTETVSIKDAPQEFKLSLSTQVSDTYKPGDYIKADAQFKEINRAYKNSYYADGVYISANSYNVTHCDSPQKLTLRVLGARISSVIKNKISVLFPKDTIGLLNGLLVGDTSAMTDESHLNFVGSGMIHLVNVSGLHLSIIAGTIYKLLKKLNKVLATVISSASVVAIIAVTGFSESTLRAGIMFLVMLLAGTVSRKSDPLNSLGLSMLIMLAVNPMLYASGSFLLTCASVSGIVLFQGPVSEYVCAVFKTMLKPFAKIVKGNILEKPARFAVKFLHKAWDLSAVGIAASIAVTPILLIIYGNISLLSPVANLLAVTLVMYALIALLITLGISFIPGLAMVAKPLVFIISLVCRYTEWVAEFFGSTNVSSVTFNTQTAFNLVVFMLITCGALLIVNSVKRLRFITVAILCVTVPLTAALALNLKPKSGCKILIPDVGSGYCAVVVYQDAAIIIGTGDDYDDGYIIEQELNRQSVSTVRAVVVPNSLNAAGAAKRLANTYNCDIYTEGTQNFEKQKNIGELNLKLGDFSISALKGEAGYTVLAKARSESFLFQAYALGEVKSITNCSFLICSPGVAASSFLPTAETTIIIGSTPFAQGNINVNSSVYVLNQSGIINIPESGEIQVLTTRTSSYAY